MAGTSKGDEDKARHLVAAASNRSAAQRHQAAYSRTHPIASVHPPQLATLTDGWRGRPLRRPALPDGAPGRSPLTAREAEVAARIAQGLSNREIAAALTIMERTVMRHVEHILAKLGLRSRTQIAVWHLVSGIPTPAPLGAQVNTRTVTGRSLHLAEVNRRAARPVRSPAGSHAGIAWWLPRPELVI